jgi:hypothetical protein
MLVTFLLSSDAMKLDDHLDDRADPGRFRLLHRALAGIGAAGGSGGRSSATGCGAGAGWAE